MIAASLAIRVQTSQLERGAGPVAVLPPAENGVPEEQPISPVLVDGRAISSALEAHAASSPDANPGAVVEGNGPARTVMHDLRPVLDASELSRSSNLEHLRRFLDDPSLKRFFLVQSGPKNDSEQAVASVVEHTTHLDFFKITVSQGIVIDPRHPDAATVFAFVLEPNEADRFHDQLKAALPGLVEQKPLDPAFATALAEISEVQSLSPTLLAKVEIPREALALRTKASVGGDAAHNEAETITTSRETASPAAGSEHATDAGRAVAPASRAGQAKREIELAGWSLAASDPGIDKGSVASA